MIQLIPHISSWSVPPQISNFDLQPLDVRTVVGRRRKRRIPLTGEELTTPKCNRCKESDHNRATCQNPIALHPADQADTPAATLPTQLAHHASKHEFAQDL